MVVTGMVVMLAVVVFARRERRHRDHDHHDEKQRQKLFHGRILSTALDGIQALSEEKNHI
jgi:hypothetical protein